MESRLAKNLAAVLARIEQAASRSGRNADEIKLVAVSKTHPAAVLMEAVAVGVMTLGENKVQEGQEKIPVVGRDSAEWHLIGHLQSNKARKAVQLFDVIESLDSLELAERLERICLEEQRASLPVFVQVDLANEETKSGIPEHEVPELVEFLQSCKALKLEGLMVVPPYVDEPEDVRLYFQRLRSLPTA